MASGKDLAPAERLKEKLLEMSPIWMWAGSPDAETGYYGGPVAEALTGYPVEAFIERPSFFFELVHPEDRQSVAASHEEAVLTGKGTSFDYRLLHRDGSVRWCRNMLVPEFDNEGKHTAFYGYTIDITESMRLEQHVRQGELLRLVGQLSRGLAHDFNNLLAGLSGAVEFLALNQPDNALVQETAQEVFELVDRGRELARGYVALGREGGGGSEFSDAHATISSLAGFLRRTVDRRIQILEVLDANNPRVLIDPGVLHSIILNLLVNSCQAMPQGGALTLQTSLVESVPSSAVERMSRLGPSRGLARAHKFLRLDIRDEGPGIEPRILDRIFQPFFTTKAEHDGAGLGLFLVHGILRNTGGAIDVHSEPGKGATFSVYLPSCADITGRTRESKLRSSFLPVAGKTLLVVDDEKALRQFLTNALTTFGVEVLAGASGREALELARANLENIDAVLLDLRMPGLDGVETLRQLRETGLTAPAILMSGNVHDLRVAADSCEGIFGSLPKPFRLEPLVDLLVRALDSTTK